MKKILSAVVGAVLALSFLNGCGGETKKPEDFGYGNSADGREITGEWEYSDSGVSTKDSSTAENVVYKSGMNENYSFSFDITVEENSAENDWTFGGYAYYKDNTNYVSFLMNTDEKCMEVESVKGYDKQSLKAFYPAETDFAQPVSVQTVKIGNEIRFIMDGKLITTVQDTYPGAGQVGFMAEYVKVSFENVSVAQAAAFEQTPVMNEVYTPAAGMPGTWETEGNKVSRIDTDPETANFESVIFNSAVANDYSFKASAKQTSVVEGGYGFYGVVAYYQNASNYAIVFFKDIYVDVCVMFGGTMVWTGGIETPNVPEDGNHIVEGTKVGDTMRIYVNGEFIRELRYSMFTRPGSVGFDTNGAPADFEMIELKTDSDLADEAYNKAAMCAVNFPALLEYEDGVYKTVANEFATENGVNYGGVVEAWSAIAGNHYEYKVKVDTTYLMSNAANATGIYGGINVSSIGILLKGNGKCDLYGVYSDMDGNEVNGFAGQEKDLPASAFTDGVLNETVTVECVWDGEAFIFKIEGEEMYRVQAAGFAMAKPGILANYVGASFEIV